MDPKKIRIAEHIQVTWLPRGFAPAVCPNCGTAAPALQYLEIDYRPPDAVHKFVLQVCRNCTARFVDNTHTMDYGTNELIELGWDTYQIQLGAGAWSIAWPLTRIEKPAGAKALEIGGAYGFGLDFCIRGRGWQGLGYDPSPLALFGARELGLDIRQEYFGEADLRAGPWDVVIATEVVEHLDHPPEFFKLMRQALAPDGLLVLTTPDADWITPELSAGELMPLLSPGAHLVVQTKASLEHALVAAGFAHVDVRRDVKTLVAFASAAPFALNENDAAARVMYRHYLVERGRISPAGSDALLGFAGRGLFEAANDADFAEAEAAWEIVQTATRERFGLDLSTLTELPAGVEGASLSELARLIPLGLGMICFGRAMQMLGTGAGRAAVLPVLRLAAAGVRALQAALAQRSLTDQLSASIGLVVEMEILLSLAELGDEAGIDRLAATGDLARGWQAFVTLVNDGKFEKARRLKAAMRLDMPAPPYDAAARNALFAVGVLALQNKSEARRSVAVFARLRNELVKLTPKGRVPDAIFWPALRGEVMGLLRLRRAEEAMLLLRTFQEEYPGIPDDLIEVLAGMKK
jgi:SAM-dependent methyltransferase